jgi:flagellin-like hook-associated protein FlgL
MPITLGSNIASLITQRALLRASDGVSKALERLSSGLRINRASDDAAGLAVASSLNSEARIFAQGIRNINDGLNLLQIAEGAVSSLGDIVTRQQELATQAANGAYSSTQRRALDTELQALAQEYNRIVHSTSFNGAMLLDQSFGTSSIQAGYSSIEFSLGAGLAQVVGDGTFQAAVSFGTGLVNSSTLVAADFDQDGYLDIATTGQGTSIGVRLANADGSFKAGVNYTRGNGATGGTLSVADINNDSIVDLVTTDSSALTISILLGNANGSFKARISSPLSFGPSAHLASDLNSDGKIDLFIGDGTDRVQLLYGNGDGTFSTGASYFADADAHEFAYADFTEDGYSDLLVAYSGFDVMLLVANADGSFQAPSSFLLGGGVAARSVAVEDFNNDGFLDFAAGIPSVALSVRLGNGNGTFRATQSYAVSIGDFQGQVLALDLNADGAIDLVSTADANAVNVLLGNGNGTFGASITYPTGVVPEDVVAADMNRDGAIDLVTVDNTPNTFSILYANTRTISDQPSMSIRTVSDARSALTRLEILQTQVGLEKAAIGNTQSRFAVAASHLQTTELNYRTAASRIIDADVAAEAAQLTRQRILQTTAAAILAQANQEPALALRLLSLK